MDEDGRRTAPMTIWDEPASEPAEAGGLGELNGGRMLQEQLKRVRQRVVHRDGTPFRLRRTYWLTILMVQLDSCLMLKGTILAKLCQDQQKESDLN